MLAEGSSLILPILGLLKPLDEFILRGTRKRKDWTGTVVSDLKLYIDRTSHKTRGLEAAEFPLEQKIRTG